MREVISATGEIVVIDADAALALGWERVPDVIGRPGKGITAYADTDPRVDPAECAHGQILDLPTGPGPLCRCTDCGALVDTAARCLPEGVADVLDDAGLAAARTDYNARFFTPPDIPQEA